MTNRRPDRIDLIHVNRELIGVTNRRDIRRVEDMRNGLTRVDVSGGLVVTYDTALRASTDHREPLRSLR